MREFSIIARPSDTNKVYCTIKGYEGIYHLNIEEIESQEEMGLCKTVYDIGDKYGTVDGDSGYTLDFGNCSYRMMHDGSIEALRPIIRGKKDMEMDLSGTDMPLNIYSTEGVDLDSVSISNAVKGITVKKYITGKIDRVKIEKSKIDPNIGIIKDAKVREIGIKDCVISTKQYKNILYIEDRNEVEEVNIDNLRILRGHIGSDWEEVKVLCGGKVGNLKVRGLNARFINIALANAMQIEKMVVDGAVGMVTVADRCRIGNLTLSGGTNKYKINKSEIGVIKSKCWHPVWFNDTTVDILDADCSELTKSDIMSMFKGAEIKRAVILRKYREDFGELEFGDGYRVITVNELGKIRQILNRMQSVDVADKMVILDKTVRERR